MYVFPNVQRAMARRLEALKHPQFVEAFVIALQARYERGKKTYKFKGREIKENRFRWHDSGDLQNLAHLRAIVDIALALPHIRFWLPTREVTVLRQWAGDFPPNLAVRYSTPLVGAKLSKLPCGLVLQSTVGRDDDKTVFQCRAPKQENQCKNCDACWAVDNLVTNYHLH